MLQPPYIGQNQTGKFPINKFLIKSLNFHNSRTSNDIDMELNKRNTKSQKN